MSAITTPQTTTAPGVRAGIDPRGPQLGAALTTVLLTAVLVTTPSPVATGLLVLQTLLFALGVVHGVQRTPYAWLFRRVVRPRLGPPGDLEDPAPPRFAQGVGLAFVVIGLVGLLSGLTALALVAIGLALVAALLNAVFGLCLGCELYLVTRRISSAVSG